MKPMRRDSDERMNATLNRRIPAASACVNDHPKQECTAMIGSLHV
jgi:hypothetical protein